MVPMTYTLGTSAATVRAAPLLLVDLDTHEGVTGHAYQFCYTACRRARHRAVPRRHLRSGAQPRAGTGRPLGHAFEALHAHWSARHRAHGDGARRYRRVGRARAGSRASACALPRRRAAADPRIQQQRPRIDAARSACRRSGTTARRRIPRGQAATWVCHARRGSRRRSCRAPARPGRGEGHGRLQPGADRARSAAARRRTRWRRRLLDRGADPPRRLRRLRRRLRRASRRPCR